MNGLQIFGVKDIKVKQDSNFDSFATLTMTVTDRDNKRFQLQLFTKKDFTPNLEIEHVND